MENQAITKSSASLPKKSSFHNAVGSTQETQVLGESLKHLMLVIALLALKGDMMLPKEKIGSD